jgi:hypothetical protein
MVFIALLPVAAGALYIRLRWRRAPQAYHAMIVLALGYFIAGALAATWALHRAAPQSAEVVATRPGAPVAASGLAAGQLPNRYTNNVVGGPEQQPVHCLYRKLYSTVDRSTGYLPIMRRAPG